jgi:hypothetical protein
LGEDEIAFENNKSASLDVEVVEVEVEVEEVVILGLV